MDSTPARGQGQKKISQNTRRDQNSTFEISPKRVIEVEVYEITEPAGNGTTFSSLVDSYKNKLRDGLYGDDSFTSYFSRNTDRNSSFTNNSANKKQNNDWRSKYLT